MGVFVRWSESRQRFDVPNERSSHEIPTPVGGGIVFVAITVLVWGSAAFFSPLYLKQILILCLAGLVIAIVSWIDDERPINPLIRFSVHIAGAVSVVLAFGSPDAMGYGPLGTLDLFPMLSQVLSVLWIVWMTNAFNFMDGIDGIAGGQATVCCIGWFLLLSVFGIPEFATGILVLVAGILGFLIYNWPPAKVFMGDVGSAFLGFLLASIPFAASFLAGKNESVYFLSAIAFTWPFLFDSVYTFLKRLFAGEKVWKAHRKHIYQRLIKAGYSHLSVSLTYTGISIVVVIMSLFETVLGISYLSPIAFVAASFVLIGLSRSVGQVD